MTLDQFKALTATIPRRYRHRVAGAVHALEEATRSGESQATAIRRIASSGRYRDALMESGQLANFHGIAEPAPVLTRLSPRAFVVGSRNVAIHCLGAGFTEESQIVFAGNPERTDFWTPGDISTVIYSDVWTSTDPAIPVFVQNPTGVSETLTFPILAPSPAAMYADS